MFERVKAWIAKVRKAPETIAQRVAPRLQALMREKSRTRRGFIPLFAGKPKWSANIPTTVTANGDTMTINGADWVLAKANANGLADDARAMVAEETRAMREGR